MNIICLVGRNVKESADCLRYSTNGVAIFKNTLAVDSFNGKEKITDFIPYVLFAAQAENAAKYTKKGSQVAIHGSLHIRSFEGQDGQKRYQTEVTADTIKYLDKKDSNTLGNEVNVDDSPF